MGEKLNGWEMGVCKHGDCIRKDTHLNKNRMLGKRGNGP